MISGEKYISNGLDIFAYNLSNQQCHSKVTFVLVKIDDFKWCDCEGYLYLFDTVIIHEKEQNMGKV